jgi:hypothetical protein
MVAPQLMFRMAGRQMAWEASCARRYTMALPPRALGHRDRIARWITRNRCTTLNDSGGWARV